MKIIDGLYRCALVVLPVSAILSSFYKWPYMSVSIAIGGSLALLNIKALSWGVGGLLGSEKAAPRLLFFSYMRLVALFIIIAVLAAYRVVDLIGIMIGFTIILILLLVEGVKAALRDMP